MEDLIVLYEDNQVVVVVKPQNVPSQADITGDLDMLTIVKNYIGKKYNKTGNVFIGLVHRLDRPTGGVMVFARTSKSAARLSEQIKEGELEKKYLAVVNNRLRDKRGRLVNYLIKDEDNNIVKVVPAAIEGAKKAVLDYNTLEYADDLQRFGCGSKQYYIGAFGEIVFFCQFVYIEHDDTGHFSA